MTPQQALLLGPYAARMLKAYQEQPTTAKTGTKDWCKDRMKYNTTSIR